MNQPTQEELMALLKNAQPIIPQRHNAERTQMKDFFIGSNVMYGDDNCVTINGTEVSQSQAGETVKDHLTLHVPTASISRIYEKTTKHSELDKKNPWLAELITKQEFADGLHEVDFDIQHTIIIMNTGDIIFAF
jgi:hypothetical protein